MSECRGCGQAIRFEVTANGKRNPISEATGESHFIDCPQAKRFKRLSALERFTLANELVQLCADAIRRQHPQGRALGRVGFAEVMTWPDERIVKAVDQMRAWLEEHKNAPAVGLG